MVMGAKVTGSLIGNRMEVLDLAEMGIDACGVSAAEPVVGKSNMDIDSIEDIKNIFFIEAPPFSYVWQSLIHSIDL